jgi:hypothetical protein
MDEEAGKVCAANTKGHSQDAEGGRGTSTSNNIRYTGKSSGLTIGLSATSSSLHTMTSRVLNQAGRCIGTDFLNAIQDPKLGSKAHMRTVHPDTLQTRSRSRAVER